MRDVFFIQCPLKSGSGNEKKKKEMTTTIIAYELRSLYRFDFWLKSERVHSIFFLIMQIRLQNLTDCILNKLKLANFFFLLYALEVIKEKELSTSEICLTRDARKVNIDFST